MHLINEERSSTREKKDIKNTITLRENTENQEENIKPKEKY